MIMIPDKTGRFPQRPHWEIKELEERCEQTITRFCLSGMDSSGCRYQPKR
jgi:hypothetical protein